MSQKKKLRWLRLDNAAKIYPAARRKTWSNVFRVSATLAEPVDTAVLQSALDATVPRFPSIAARLRKGAFWYYLQQLENAPKIREEYSYPLTRMSKAEVRRCAFRVIAYENRVAVELFHSLTDGSGALVFLKTLIAEYLEQKYGITIPGGNGVLDRKEPPKEEELADSFQKYSGSIHASRKERSAWRVYGTPEEDNYLHQTCFQLPVADILEQAHKMGYSLTVYLSGIMMLALQSLQAERIPSHRWRKPIRLQIPVNLRNLFPSKTLRNFALYVTPEILPRLGDYSLEEICAVIHHCMGAEITPKIMSTKIAANVSSERMMAVKLMPLFLKNMVMKIIFDTVGEKKSCLSLSNLGRVTLPEVMAPYVKRMDFILGVQATAPYNCGALSYGDTLYVNFIRNIRQPDLERHFYRVLQSLQLPVQVQGNPRG